MGMLAELTHRCPLQCPYCSNPLELERANGELTTAELVPGARRGGRARRPAAASVGRRADRAARPRAIVAHARPAGLYTNLITAGVLLDEARVHACARPGSTMCSSSFQGGGRHRRPGRRLRGGHAKKLAVARLIRAAGLPLTVNAVVHRQNLDQLAAMIALALELDAHRLEVAHVQYYGWALRTAPP